MTRTTNLAPLLERFFAQRLMQQRQVSPHTISSYRDTFRQFLKFAHKRLGTPPSRLSFEQIDAPLITAFLEEIETRRGVSVRTRNLRLTAIHSFFRYAAFELPTHAGQIQRVLAIPSKRFTRKLVRFLARPEVDALLAAPDRSTWSGRRDHAFILTAVQTGLRLSEMTGLTREDVISGGGAHLRVLGKGRKERCTPLVKPTRVALKAWLREPPRGVHDWLFPSARGERLTVHGGAVPVEQAPSHGFSEMSLVDTATRHGPPLAAYRGDGPSSGRRRSRGDRVVARTRIGRDHADLPGGDAGNEREGTGQDHTANRQARPLPARRLAARLPQQPVSPSRLCRVRAAGDLLRTCRYGAESPLIPSCPT